MGEFFDRLIRDHASGTITDGEIRYVMFRADVIVGLINALDPPIRANTLRQFAATVADRGGDSLNRYFDTLNGDIEALIDTVAATAADLGWGQWVFERNPESMTLRVCNSPFIGIDNGDGGPSCAPIDGIFQALAALAGYPSSTRLEVDCAGRGAAACRFVAARPAPPA